MPIACSVRFAPIRLTDQRTLDLRLFAPAWRRSTVRPSPTPCVAKCQIAPPPLATAPRYREHLP